MSFKPKIVEEIFHHRHVKNNGDIIEIHILLVEKDKSHPEGIRYSLAYVRNNKSVVQYDNHLGHGHHKHIKGKRLSYNFVDEWKLLRDFEKDLKEQDIDL